MGLDEAMLTLAPAGQTLLRFYRWLRPGGTFGYSQKLELASRLAAARGMGSADLVRRATGGGVVFHDGDLTFSIVFPWEKLSAPDLIYKNIHRGVHMGLKAVGIPSRLFSGPACGDGSALEKACFIGSPERADLIRDDGMKILGGALRRRGTIGLYQGSFRPEVLSVSVSILQQAITDGISKEFGPITLNIGPNSFDYGIRLAEKYRSSDWNQKR